MELIIAFTSESAADKGKALVDHVLNQGARSVLLLAADGNACRAEDFNLWLSSLPVPIAGGVFPQLIYETRNYESGYIAVGWPEPFEVVNLPGLSDPETDHAAAVEKACAGRNDPKSLIVLVDGLSTSIAAFLDGIYDALGSEVVCFGGGAGSLSFRPKPCLFSNAGLLQDHGQLVILAQSLRLGVDHGWIPLAGPFVVTASRRNVLESLDFRPAFEVYREFVESDGDRTFTEDNFFEIAKGYPFGMQKPDGSVVVRDPITRSGNTMACVGEVPANSLVYLLRGEADNLVAAAGAAAAAVSSMSSAVLAADCISRVLFLQDDFGRELEVIKRNLGNRPLVGVLTLGEIAGSGGRCLEFYNKTLVLAALCDA